MVAHLTPDERIARGRAARAKVPRSSHGVFAPSASRPDSVALLEKQAATRLPELVAIRHGRMLVSPLTFFRGAALVMASDLGSLPIAGIRTQVCGDAHISNFGAYASPERRMIFDVNDFDETLPGPWEWDVKRLVASLAVAGSNNRFTLAQRRSIVMAAAAEYRNAMSGFAGMPTIDVWYSHVDVDELLLQVKTDMSPSEYKQLTKDVTKARSLDSARVFSKLTKSVDGKPRFVSEPPVTVPVSKLYPKREAERIERSLLDVVNGYRSTLPNERRHLLDGYRFVELARKVVGVGSVGTWAWILLFVGRDEFDPLVLQAKEAEESVLEAFAGSSQFKDHGERVVSGQRLMQAVSDIFLGWQRMRGPDGREHHYYVRQFRDWKWSPDVSTLSASALKIWGQLCAWTLAHGHARSGDCIAIAAYLGQGDTFDRAMASFAEAYADQNESDYMVFRKAVKAGRITAATGV
ncbi:MAG TPA: DUF2252 domain-containing protein [Candidatus Dormibacteraeota bacterium]|nr:DUF2252 domain-containing protein [Candidatus Dormibacteraeota bacterium]